MNLSLSLSEFANNMLKKITRPNTNTKNNINDIIFFMKEENNKIKCKVINRFFKDGIEYCNIECLGLGDKMIIMKRNDVEELINKTLINKSQTN